MNKTVKNLIESAKAKVENREYANSVNSDDYMLFDKIAGEAVQELKDYTGWDWSRIAELVC